MNLPDIKADLLRKLDVEDTSDAEAWLLADVLTAVNTAGQVLNAAGTPFWMLETSDVGVSESAPSVTLSTARAVKSVGRLITPLFKAESLYDVTNFHSLYLRETDAAAAAKEHQPQCYYPEISGGQVVLHFGPRKLPATAVNVRVAYTPKFTPWTTADLSDATKEPLVPFEMVETAFLPLARFYITRSHRFHFQERLLGQLTADYQAAVGLIRSLNPSVPMPDEDQLRLQMGGVR